MTNFKPRMPEMAKDEIWEVQIRGFLYRVKIVQAGMLDLGGEDPQATRHEGALVVVLEIDGEPQATEGAPIKFIEAQYLQSAQKIS